MNSDNSHNLSLQQGNISSSEENADGKKLHPSAVPEVRCIQQISEVNLKIKNRTINHLFYTNRRSGIVFRLLHLLYIV